MSKASFSFVDNSNIEDIEAFAAEARATANEANRVASDTAHHFWFNSSGSDTGAHISEQSKAEFEANPSGGNLLANSNGVAIRDGTAELAAFLSGGIDFYDEYGDSIAHFGETSWLGARDSEHIKITTAGLVVYTGAESDDSNVAQFGTEARIGAINTPHLTINKSGTTSNATLHLDAYNSAGKNFGSLYFAADRSADTFSSYFMAKDIDDPASVAKRAGISLRAGSDPTVSITGKQMYVESIYRSVPNADRTLHSISADAVGAIKSLDKSSVSVSLATGTWTDLTGGFVQLGSGTWLIMGSAVFDGSESGKCGLRVCASTEGAYNDDRTAYTTGSALVPVASSSTRISAFAIINTTAGATQCWLNAYSTKADTISGYHIRAVHIF